MQADNHLPAVSENLDHDPASNGDHARQELFRDISSESLGSKKAKANLSEVFQVSHGLENLKSGWLALRSLWIAGLD